MSKITSNNNYKQCKLLNKNRILSLLMTSALVSSAGIAQAQIVTDEIIVTAQKKEQSLQSVGIAVTAYSGEQIEALGFQNTTDIVYQTPGLQLYEFSPTITVYNIRGVSQNSFADNLEGPIAVYIDDGYVSALGAQNQPIYDVERVEVLKGPQGTLYGRNATGGLIHYISRKPTDEFEARGSASFGSYNYHEVEASISGPISDNIRARIAAVDTKEDGYLKSTNPAVRDAYGKNATAVKAFLEVDAGDSTTVTLNPYWSKDSDVPTGAYVRVGAQQDPATGLGLAAAAPADPFSHSSDAQGRFDREIFGVTGKLEHDFSDNLKLTSITNYQEMDKYYFEDSEGRNLTVGDIIGFGPAFADFNSLGVFNFATNSDFQQFSQEIRLSGDTDKLSWQAGGFYLDIQQSNFALVEGLAALFTNPDTFNPGIGQGFTSQARSDFNIDSKSISVFAQGDYALSDNVKLVAGLRIVNDDKEFDSFIRYQEVDPTVSDLASGVGGANAPAIDVLQIADGSDFPGFPVQPVPAGFLASFAPICYSSEADARCANDVADPGATFEYTDWAGKLQLEYTTQSGSLLYAGINRGTKGGNWAAPNFPDSARANGLDSLAHTEETLWSYEAGFKHSFANGLGRFNAAAFYYDYDDYQAFSLTNFVQNISNNDATVLGAEFELALNPADGLDLLLGGSFIDSEVKGIVTPNGSVIDTELPNAPSVSLNALARYGFEIGKGELSFQLDGNYNGSQFLEVTNPGSAKEDSYMVANARIAYAMDNDITVAGWVRNLTNTEYRVYSLDVAGAPSPFINDVYARPSTYGITVSGKF